MNKKVTKVVLLSIILLATILRLWRLGTVPIAPDWDEASLGYNAYALLHTGHDEYGKFLPIVLQSFNDYKPALYAYLIIPFIALFHLSVFVVRLPSALFGIATVFATFFLVKELCKRNEISLFSAFFLAISPWHIQFSRVAFESNIGLACNVFSALFFLKALKKPRFFILSIFFAGMSLYAYQSEKVFTPLLFFSLICIYRQKILGMSKKFLLGMVVWGSILLFPLMQFILFQKGGLARANGVSIFTHESSYLMASRSNILYDKKVHDVLGLAFDNHWVVLVRELLGNYLSHFNLNWLFLSGDISRHHAPDMGLLYLCELPLVLIGIYHLIFGKYGKKAKLFIVSWFFIAPIPSALANGAPHAVRTLNFLPMYQIFIAIGVLFCIKKLWHKKMGKVCIALYGFLFLFNFFYYLNQYFVQQNYYTAKDWQYGYAQTIAEVTKVAPAYQKIVVSSHSPLDQSYIFFLFYLAYPPQKYQKEQLHKPVNVEQSFGKFVFRTITWEEDKQQKNTLYVGSPQDFPFKIIPIKTVRYPNGEPAMLLVSKKL